MNAKDEFLKLVKDRQVVCADILHDDGWERHQSSKHKLLYNYTDEEYSDFINSLNFEYNDGYGGQELFGTVWFQNGIWAERGEYDGSEWWEIRIMPAIPDFLIKKTRQNKK